MTKPLLLLMRGDDEARGTARLSSRHGSVPKAVVPCQPPPQQASSPPRDDSFSTSLAAPRCRGACTSLGLARSEMQHRARLR
ncbi:unnamed protein product [Lampetra planeri]